LRAKLAASQHFQLSLFLSQSLLATGKYGEELFVKFVGSTRFGIDGIVVEKSRM
jgi:hypothetical protein